MLAKYMATVRRGLATKLLRRTESSGLQRTKLKTWREEQWGRKRSALLGSWIVPKYFGGFKELVQGATF